MYELPEDFNRDGELSFVTPASDGETFICMIGGERVPGWSRDEEEGFISLEETSYKNYKFYTDGAMIDLIQKLGHHNLSTFEAGRDEDGDAFWKVSFAVEDFEENYGFMPTEG